jgi:hypothetical protein
MTLLSQMDIVWFGESCIQIYKYFVALQVVLWHAETLKQKATLEDHSLLITDVRFSPSGPCLATSSFDKTVRVWDVDNVSLCDKSTVQVFFTICSLWYIKLTCFGYVAVHDSVKLHLMIYHTARFLWFSVHAFSVTFVLKLQSIIAYAVNWQRMLFKQCPRQRSTIHNISS